MSVRCGLSTHNDEGGGRMISSSQGRPVRRLSYASRNGDAMLMHNTTILRPRGIAVTVEETARSRGDPPRTRASSEDRNAAADLGQSASARRRALTRSATQGENQCAKSSLPPPPPALRYRLLQLTPTTGVVLRAASRAGSSPGRSPPRCSSRARSMSRSERPLPPSRRGPPTQRVIVVHDHTVVQRTVVAPVAVAAPVAVPVPVAAPANNNNVVVAPAPAPAPIIINNTTPAAPAPIVINTAAPAPAAPAAPTSAVADRCQGFEKTADYLACQKEVAAK